METMQYFVYSNRATCPTDNVSTIDAKRQAYGLLLSKGLIRIGLPVPATIATTGNPTEYQITLSRTPTDATPTRSPA
jgi:hypothetical protein